MTKLLPTLRKHKLSKKAQEKGDKIKRKLHTANRNWNYWNFQLHWNKLEWVNSRGKIKRKNTIQPLQRNTILIKMIERLIGLAIHY